MTAGKFKVDVSLDSTVEGQPVLRFRRRYGQDIERLWRALSEDSELSAWFPCSVRLEQQIGGTIEFRFPGQEPDQGKVLELDPPHLLAFSWDQEVLRWRLQPDAGGSLLMLTNTIQDPAKVANVAAGWHGCLEQLAAFLDGSAGDTGQSHEQLVRHYSQALGQ